MPPLREPTVPAPRLLARRGGAKTLTASHRALTLRTQEPRLANALFAWSLP